MDLAGSNCLIEWAFKIFQIDLKCSLVKNVILVQLEGSVTTKMTEEKSLVINRSTESSVLKVNEEPAKPAQLKRIQSTSFSKKYYDLHETEENVGT